MPAGHLCREKLTPTIVRETSTTGPESGSSSGTDSEDRYCEPVPNIFKGLGKLKDNYVIKLRENATPYALTTPRRVPLPLLPKVKEELQRMEPLGVIMKIEEPTDWCAGM